MALVTVAPEVLVKIALTALGRVSRPPIELGMAIVLSECNDDELWSYHGLPAMARMLEAAQVDALRAWRDRTRAVIEAVRRLRSVCVNFRSRLDYVPFAEPYIAVDCALRLSSHRLTDRVVVLGSDAGAAYSTPVTLRVPKFRLIEVYNTERWMPARLDKIRDDTIPYADMSASLRAWFASLALLVAVEGDRPWWRLGRLVATHQLVDWPPSPVLVDSRRLLPNRPRPTTCACSLCICM